MIGTIYDRLSAVVRALQREGFKPEELSLRGHPDAIRPFALCFDRDKYPDRSKAEVTFREDGLVMWRGMPVYQDGKLGEFRERIWVCIANRYAVRVDVGAFPIVEGDCPDKYRPAVERAVASISPKAAT